MGLHKIIIAVKNTTSARYNTNNITTSYCTKGNDFRLQLYNAIAASSPCLHKAIVFNTTSISVKLRQHYVAIILTDEKTTPCSSSSDNV